MDKLIQTETRGCGQVPLVNSLHVGYFFMRLMYLLSFAIFSFKIFFQEHYPSAKWFGSRSGPNCLQRLSAIAASKERVRIGV